MPLCVRPFFGDLMFNAIGVAGCLFVLFLIWEGWNERRCRIRRQKRTRDRARTQ